MVLEVEGLSKSFGSRPAIAGIDLVVEAGEVLALLGPDGAGKTTLLRLCAGVIEPDRGRVRVFKVDVALERRRAQTRLGYVPAAAPVDLDLTPWSYLVFLAGLRGFDSAGARHAVRDAAGAAGLDREILREGRRLSLLERRQVALAAALLCDPLVLLLDEPFAGFDDRDAQRFADRLAAVATPERAVVLTTATREPAARIAGRVERIAEGRLLGPDPAPAPVVAAAEIAPDLPAPPESLSENAA